MTKYLIPKLLRHFLFFLFCCLFFEGIAQTDTTKFGKEAKRLLDSKQYRQAISLYNQMLNISPDKDKIYYNRGLAYTFLMLNDSAYNDFTIAIKFNPKNARAFLARSQVYSSYGLFKEAEADIYKAKEVDSTDVIIYNDLGYLRTMQGMHGAAIPFYDKCIRLAPKYDTAYINKSISLAELGKVEEAIKVLDLLISIKPKYANAYFERGGNYKKLNNNVKAMADYDYGLKLSPENSVFRVVRANLKFAMDDKKGAEDDYLLAIKNDSTYAWAYYATGRFKAKIGDQQNALKYYSLGAKWGPKDLTILMAYADLLFTLDKKEEACEVYKKAEKLGSGAAISKRVLNCKN